MQDEPGVVTDYASLLRAQTEYKVDPPSDKPASNTDLSLKAMILQTSGALRCLLALMLPSLAKPRK